MCVQELKRRTDRQYPHINHSEKACAIRFLQGHAEDSQGAHVEQDMGETLMREGCSDYSIVLVCTDDWLVVEAEDKGRTVRITYKYHLPDEDQNVYGDGESSV